MRSDAAPPGAAFVALDGLPAAFLGARRCKRRLHEDPPSEPGRADVHDRPFAIYRGRWSTQFTTMPQPRCNDAHVNEATKLLFTIEPGGKPILSAAGLVGLVLRCSNRPDGAGVLFEVPIPLQLPETLELFP